MPRIVIVGAGPIGLEAGIRAREMGFEVSVYEAGKVADAVQRWSHVTLFSPFGMNRSPLGVRVLSEAGVDVPSDDSMLTGKAFVERYLLPLSEREILRDCVRTHARVVSIGRRGMLKHEGVGDGSRAGKRFRLLIRGEDGAEFFDVADVAIDASGTFGQSRPVGADGLPAIGESGVEDRIRPPLEDILGGRRNLYANRRTLVVGSGYSAATNVVALAKLAEREPQTEVTWLTRRFDERPIKVIDNDRLPERLSLATRANELAKGGSPVQHIGGYSIERIVATGEGELTLQMTTQHGQEKSIVVDQMIPNTGFVPDRSIYRELQVHECYATEGPIRLAATLMKQGTGDCLDMPVASAEVLQNPEPGFFVIGSKSYGRNSSFLLRTGLEQIDQLFGGELIF